MSGVSSGRLTGKCRGFACCGGKWEWLGSRGMGEEGGVSKVTPGAHQCTVRVLLSTESTGQGSSLLLWEAFPWSFSLLWRGNSVPHHTGYGSFCWECWNIWPCIWLFGFPLQMPSIASAVREKNTCYLFYYVPKNTFSHSFWKTPRNDSDRQTILSSKCSSLLKAHR